MSVRKNSGNIDLYYVHNIICSQNDRTESEGMVPPESN